MFHQLIITMTKHLLFSSNLIQFYETASQYGHYRGRLVNFNNNLLVIGGGFANTRSWNAKVEEFAKPIWNEHPKMSPVNNLNDLRYFSAVSMEDSLYIFG